MLSRRRFMFLLGGAATGVWLASTGLVKLERTFVLSLGGSCSFCGKVQRDVRALVGTPNQPTKICDECVGLCCDILGEEAGVQSPRDVHSYAAPNFEDEQFQQHAFSSAIGASAMQRPSFPTYCERRNGGLLA